MPKVSKESVYLGHDLGTVKMEIVFSAKFGSFTIKLPDQVKNILGKGEVSSETFDGVKNEFKMAMKAYRQAVTRWRQKS